MLYLPLCNQSSVQIPERFLPLEDQANNAHVDQYDNSQKDYRHIHITPENQCDHTVPGLLERSRGSSSTHGRFGMLVHRLLETDSEKLGDIHLSSQGVSWTHWGMLPAASLLARSSWSRWCGRRGIYNERLAFQQQLQSRLEIPWRGLHHGQAFRCSIVSVSGASER